MLVALLVLAVSACADSVSAPAGESPTGGESPVTEAPAEAPPAETGEGACARAGCSGQLCVPAGEERMTTCEFRPEYACYRDARCERQPDGSCGFTPTDELSACLANPPAP